jgi:histone deacetylase 1/2
MASSPSATPSPSAAPRVTAAAAAKTFKHVISVKLDDSNYLQWKQQVEGVLRGKKMVKHVISPQIPSPSAAPRVTAAAAKTFKHVISVKLDDSNYLQWKQQVEGVLRGTKMVKHVISPQIPSVYLTDADRESRSENPAYTAWEEQDSLLCTWILSTISSSLLSRFVSLRQSWQVWDEVHNYCYTQMRTRSRQLRSELRSITKGSRSISEFIARIRTISESLMSIGDPVPHRDLIEVVLEALPEEFI